MIMITMIMIIIIITIIIMIINFIRYGINTARHNTSQQATFIRICICLLQEWC